MEAINALPLASVAVIQTKRRKIESRHSHIRVRSNDIHTLVLRVKLLGGFNSLLSHIIHPPTYTVTHSHLCVFMHRRTHSNIPTFWNFVWLHDICVCF